MAKTVQTLGIISRFEGSTPSFPEKNFYKKLTLYGRRRGIRVFVFSPRKADFLSRRVLGFEYRNGEWQKRLFPFPRLIYDRCFISASYRHYKPFVTRLQNDPKITFLGTGLSGKWQVYQMLVQSPEWQQWLPETRSYSMTNLLDMLKQYKAVVIKPVAGTHGTGVVRIVHTQGKYLLRGRNLSNQPFHKTLATTSRLRTFLSQFTAGRHFLVQPYLQLRTHDGHPYDVRVLVQKNGEGNWQITGKAVRIGAKQGITSNLHGGGSAIALSPFLNTLFSAEQRSVIEQEIEQIATRLPPFLEMCHGQLVELGIDIGIDLQGKVWIIEVNSRPGRSVFQLMNDAVSRAHSVKMPIEFANYLMKIV